MVEDLVTDVGGGACNLSVGFSRLGLNTALWAKVADDPAGDFVLRRLKNEKISLDFVELVENGTTSLSAILVDETGERSIIMYRASNDNLNPKQINFENIFKTRWIFVAELTGNPTPLMEFIAKESLENKVKFAFVPGLGQLEHGVAPIKEILKRTEVLIFNDYEAGKLLGRGEEARYSEEEIEKMLEELYGLGVKVAVITKDIDGAQAFDGKNFYTCLAPKVEKRVDTTGAGDAFASGFVAALTRNQSVEEALALGTKNAGSVIQQFGAQTGLIKISNFMTTTTDKVALFWEGKNGKQKQFTYKELNTLADGFANYLRGLGVEKGDRVFFFLPRIPELYWGVLGTVRAGAVVGTLFAAFGEQGLYERLKNSGAKVLVTNKELKRRVDKIKKDLPELKHILEVEDLQ